MSSGTDEETDRCGHVVALLKLKEVQYRKGNMGNAFFGMNRHVSSLPVKAHGIHKVLDDDLSIQSNQTMHNIVNLVVAALHPGLQAIIKTHYGEYLLEAASNHSMLSLTRLRIIIICPQAVTQIG